MDYLINKIGITDRVVHFIPISFENKAILHQPSRIKRLNFAKWLLYLKLFIQQHFKKHLTSENNHTMFTRYFKLMALGISLLLTACVVNLPKTINGKGPVVDKTYSIDKNFDQISVHTGWQVELIKSNRPHIVLHTEKNLMPYFEYQVKDGKLIITTQENINIRKSKSRKVEVYYQQLHQFNASSSSRIFSREVFKGDQGEVSASSSGAIHLNVNFNSVVVKSSSSGDIVLSGSSQDLKANASSSGDIEMQNLGSNTTHLKASSSGEIELSTQAQSLFAKASSSGSIELSGSGQELTGKASSGGEIEAKDFKVKNAEVKVSSGGEITVFTSHHLKAESSSGGSINYYGDPQQKEVNRSTSGGEIAPGK